MNVVRACWRLLLICLITLYTIIIGYIKLSLSSDKNKVKQNVAQRWSKRCLNILNIKLELERDVSDLPVGLIMSNHRSYLDVFILLSLFPSSIVAKQEIGKWPGIRHAVDLADIILVKRGKMSSMLDTMKNIKERLRNNKSVILFPEGKIGDTYLPGRFMNGSFLIASHLDVPVIPIALYYLDENDAWVGKVSFLSHFLNNMGKTKSKVKVKILNPISNQDAKLLSHITFKLIEQGVKELSTLRKVA
ncbi:MAG: 1-acyl-sn-glycerol-3-phosphate acyltransferase [Bacteroidales bacterium]|nr:1-acyl-sn-glycerol-3-phosphate acyltransferase [Bacteroidales bacterium]